MENLLKNRRSYYSISNNSPISNHQIEEIVKYAVTYVPSAFNSQSTRIVLLIGDSHRKLWEITMNALRKIVPAEAFSATEVKINSFAAGYGTILFYEESKTVKQLQDNFPLYAANFPVWSEHTSAMHQLAIWSMLEQEGLGASLQHYSELIHDDVIKEWSLPSTWKMIAQMPFGTPTAQPAEKTFLPIEERVFVY